jgi:serine/threonine protein kinase/tetratricopeptide (TPR) repeat protein
MFGETILHYRILEKLGEGGMGVVYLAEDTKLDRRVAIKFLPRHVAGNSEERKRFEIEAKAAAALNHPNIATIYAIEEYDGEIFIVMEFIKGRELHDIIRDGQLSIEQVVEIGKQIASGLQAAHAKGIVHRDIKSSNIMVTESGQIKIMDFGLAKVAGADIQLTKEHSTLGTAAYMSPEQTRGEPVDHRTDIWSFGVLLYEMLTGKMPFRGDYEQAMIYSIINEEPQKLTELRDDISPQIENIVLKALQKNPEERYQQAGQIIKDFNDNVDQSSTPIGYLKPNFPLTEKKSRIVYFALSAIVILLIIISGYMFFGGNGSKIDSLAVLPFVNASKDDDAEYLSDGVTSSLINRLAEFPGLKVMSRLSVTRFKNGSEDPLEAGRLMGVQSILAGQLVLRGEKLIVDVEFLKVDDGRQLWGDRFERDKKNILSIEHEIVNRIGDKLEVKLAGEKQSDQENDDSIDPQAYDNYLRGRYIMLGTSDDGPARAQEYFRQAIEREPRLAIAYAGLGESYVNQAWLNSKDRDTAVPLAKAALQKAMELDPGLCEAHVLAGEIAFYFDWDWSAAGQSYRTAMELNPGSDLAHREYSSYLLWLNQPEKAIAEARIAQSLDPLSVYATHQLGYNYLATGRLSEAVVEFRKAIDLNPTWVWGNIKMGMSYALMGDTTNASKAMRRADELLVRKLPSPLGQDWLAQIAYMCGDTVRIYETIARLQNQSKLSYVDPFPLADMYYRLRDYNAMFRYIEQGYEERSPLMGALLINREFMWREVKNDPRYLNMLKRLNFPNTGI